MQIPSLAQTERRRATHLFLPIAQTDNRPPTAPSPLPRAAVAASVLRRAQFLVFARRQTNDDVGFDRAERQDAQA